jgi:hypothetical protein
LIITEIGLSALSLGDTLREWNNKRLDSIQRKAFGRVLTSAGWVGSAGSAADGKLEMFEDLNSIIKLPNIAADSVLNRDLIVALEGYIPSKHLFDIECIDAMSNTAALMMSFLEQRPGESLVGKIQGGEVTLYETLTQMALNEGNGMEATKELGHHMVDENNDRFISYCTLLGGSAALDSGIEFTVDGDFRGSLYNFSTTRALRHNSWFPANIYVPAGSTFDIACIDAFPGATLDVGLKILKLTDSQMAAAVEAAKPEGV